jgi:hypothetical protein
MIISCLIMTTCLQAEGQKKKRRNSEPLTEDQQKIVETILSDYEIVSERKSHIFHPVI